jgi:FkbM family methyltransferase
VSRTTVGARLYVALLARVMRSLPGARAKQMVLNSIHSVDWPEVDLPPQTVRVGTVTSLRIQPHFCEFDLEAVVNRTVSYEPEVFAWLEPRIENYDAIIDIGANVGVYTIFFGITASRLPATRKTPIFAFEPSRTAFLRLCRNIEINHIGNVYAFNCAVGTRLGFSDFFEPQGHMTNGSLRAEFAQLFSEAPAKTRVMTIDGDVLTGLLDGNAGRLLIKIDAEGAEAEILESLSELISRRHPDIVVEALPMFEDEMNRVSVLHDAGYRFFGITSQGLIEHPRFVASGQHRDFALLPPAGCSAGGDIV